VSSVEELCELYEHDCISRMSPELVNAMNKLIELSEKDRRERGFVVCDDKGTLYPGTTVVGTRYAVDLGGSTCTQGRLAGSFHTHVGEAIPSYTDTRYWINSYQRQRPGPHCIGSRNGVKCMTVCDPESRDGALQALMWEAAEDLHRAGSHYARYSEAAGATWDDDEERYVFPDDRSREAQEAQELWERANAALKKVLGHATDYIDRFACGGVIEWRKGEYGFRAGVP